MEYVQYGLPDFQRAIQWSGVTFFPQLRTIKRLMLVVVALWDQFTINHFGILKVWRKMISQPCLLHLCCICLQTWVLCDGSWQIHRICRMCTRNNKSAIEALPASMSCLLLYLMLVFVRRIAIIIAGWTNHFWPNTIHHPSDYFHSLPFER